MNAVSCQRSAPEQPLLTTGLLLVDAIARQVRASLGCSHPHDDMVSFGNEGLVEALNRFDPERGIPFNAFASQRIRGAIIDGMRREGWMSRRAWERASESMSDCQIGPAEYDDQALLDDCCGLTPEEVVIKSEESRSPCARACGAGASLLRRGGESPGHLAGAGIRARLGEIKQPEAAPQAALAVAAE